MTGQTPTTPSRKKWSTGDKIIASTLGLVFTLAVGGVASVHAAYHVPDLIEKGHETAAKNIVKYLPTPQMGNPLDADLEAAVAANRLGMAEFMLDHGARPYLALQKLDATEKPANYEAAMRLLLRKNLAKNADYMQREPRRAAYDNDVRELKLLVEFNAPIDGEVLSAAAAGRGTKALDYLLENFKFSDEEKLAALSAAGVDGRPDNFHYMLLKVKPDQATLNDTLVKAARRDNLTTVNYLLNAYTFSAETKEEALDAAPARYSNDCFNYLLDQPGIPRAAKIAAVRHALAEETSQTAQDLMDRLDALRQAPPTPGPGT
jgi:hypothetical protein